LFEVLTLQGFYNAPDLSASNSSEKHTKKIKFDIYKAESFLHAPHIEGGG